MSDVKKIYEKGATAADINNLKQLIVHEDLGWEDYYWAARCLWEEDTDELDSKIVESALNHSLRFGLTYKQDAEMYLNANKILATIYSQQHEYDAVLNCLGLVLEWEPNSPDWVFHDFISAQIHADYMKGILQNPKMFLSDLAKNDLDSDKVRKRQKSIFKDFLIHAILFLKENPDSKVDYQLIHAAAVTYGVENTDGWDGFCEICKGKITSKIAPIIGTGNQALPSVLATPTQSSNTEEEPLIVSLFPEDKNVEPLVTYVSFEDHKKAIDENKSLEEENTKLKKKSKKTAEAIKALKEENKKLQAENQANIELKNKERKESSKKLQTAIDENNSLKTANARLQATVKSVIDDKNAAQMASADKTNKYRAESLIKDSKINALEAENKQKDIEISELKAATQTMHTSVDTISEVLGKMQGYLYSIQCSLSGFLGHELPQISDYWWDELVIPALSGTQRTEVEESGVTSLDGLDLASLLKVFRKSFFKIAKNSTRYLSENAKETIDQILQVRNDWAHIPVVFPSNEKIVADLDIVISFMGTVGCGKSKVDDVRAYQKEIRNSKR